jgi:hypothetical protein
VLPGTYTAKLTLGDKTYEKRFEVRLDPTVNVPAADLQTQLDMLMKLRDMQSTTNTALRTLDSLKGQLEFVERTVKERLTDVPKDVADKVAEQKKQIEALQNRLARPEASGLGLANAKSQLVEHIGGLFFTIDGTNATPTPAMREQYDRVQAEFTQKLAEVNNYLSKTVPQLNETLRRLDAPTVMTGKPIEMPKP